MCDLASLVRNVAENPRQPIGFYEYPELYHFFYSRATIHGNGQQLLQRFQPHNTTRVLDLACGTGLLLSRIEDRYQTVMGVDIDGGMLELAREHTGSVTLRNADVRSWSANDEDRTFDAAVMVGALFHLTADEDVLALAENVYDALREGGSFTTAFIPFGNLEGNNLRISKTVESDRYRVEQVKTAVLTSPDGQITSSYVYEITDVADETTVSVGSVVHERLHEASVVRQAMLDTGFTTAEVLETNTPKVILTARR